MADPDIGQRLYRFPGGLKLRHHKQIACAAPLARPETPDQLALPLVQHQGPAGRPIVSAGARVLRGQPLTRTDHDRSAPIHAPTAGRIVAIEPRPVSWPPESLGDCIIVEPDGSGESVDFKPLPDWREADPDALIDRLRDAGLSGLGGAMFPTAAKLRGDWSGVDTLILNGSECEPYIACDEMLMRTRAEAIVEGGLVLARALGASSVVIAIEDQMGQVRETVQAAIALGDPEGRCRLVEVTKIYPEGGERQLIQVLTGSEVPHDGLPQDLGLACLNVATAAAAADAVVEGQPLIERIVTVSGPAIARPRNFVTMLGTPVASLVQAAGGFSSEVARLVLGGPMSGIPLATDAVPVTKGSNCILALRPADTARRQPVMPCINCGECVRVCPASLLPQELYNHIRTDDLDTANQLNLFDCIECGCCAHVCPSQIPLVDFYRHAKGALKERGVEEARAARARRRFEAREQRLAEEAERRRRKREAREQRLKSGGEARSEVQAAIERARKRAQDDPGRSE